eukprot:m.211729 g.211729  ORF g.211729 m.211729 type:complete len:134 (+) comp13785_c3_seq61:1754-2155(+)
MLSSIFFRFDFSTTLISSLGFALGSKLSTFVALRQLRIMRLLSIKKRFRLVLGTMFSLVPNMGSFAVALLLIFYSFAVLGIELFAGKLYKVACNWGFFSCSWSWLLLIFFTIDDDDVVVAGAGLLWRLLFWRE